MRALPLFLLLAGPALAQPHHHHTPQAAPGATQPHAGLERRAIKALSPDQAEDLLAGRGMGLALAAELNGYPGPMHVLEHADALRLAPAQRARAEALRAAMLAEARPIGARIVALEEELDGLFARGEADAGRLAALTAQIGALQGRLREAHLAAHVGMREALTPDQRRAYATLRGYAAR
jgi:Spy/CpxP family protein refolding chaperone